MSQRGNVAWEQIRVTAATANLLGAVKIGSGISVSADGTISATGSGQGAVASVFGRTGAVVAASGDYTVAQVTGAAASATTITAGAGLTGGGDLTANRTLAVNIPAVQTPWLQNVNAAGYTLSNVPTVSGNSASPGLTLAAGGAGPLTLQTNALTRVTVDQNGNVGIGSIAPSVPLDVLILSANTVTTVLARGSPDPNFRLMACNDAGGTAGTDQMRFGMDYSGGNWNTGIRFLRGTGSGDGFMAFDSSGAERIRIDSSGNAGIGTTNPQDTLHIGNVPYAVNSEGGLRISTTGNELTARIKLRLNSSGVGRLAFDAPSGVSSFGEVMCMLSGNVGIGTTAPAATLDVTGTIRFGTLPSANPGAGTRQLWYDPSDSNRIKFAA